MQEKSDRQSFFYTVADIPVESHYVIIGFPGCGTEELQHYLQHRFPRAKVECSDLIYGKEVPGPKISWRPVIVTRNPADRMWKIYHDKKSEDDIEFQKFIQMPGEVERSIYESYLDKWEPTDPIVLSYEALTEQKHFPTDLDPQPPTMDAFERDLVKKAIEIFKKKKEHLKGTPTPDRRLDLTERPEMAVETDIETEKPIDWDTQSVI